MLVGETEHSGGGKQVQRPPPARAGARASAVTPGRGAATVGLGQIILVFRQLIVFPLRQSRSQWRIFKYLTFIPGLKISFRWKQGSKGYSDNQDGQDLGGCARCGEKWSDSGYHLGARPENVLEGRMTGLK